MTWAAASRKAIHTACCSSAKNTTSRHCLPPASRHSPPSPEWASYQGSIHETQARREREYSLHWISAFCYFSMLIFKYQQAGHMSIKDTTHAAPDTSSPCSFCPHRAEKWKILPHSKKGTLEQALLTLGYLQGRKEICQATSS